MDSGEGADEVGDVGEVVLKPAAEERGDLTSRAASPVPTAAAAAPSLAADTIKVKCCTAISLSTTPRALLLCGMLIR